ncbi:MAG: hypothetical protein R3F60_32975 [bacterium]
MNAARRKELLEAVVEALGEEAERRPLTSFLPLPSHRQLLRDSIIVIVGERGAGKTALFQFLAALQESHPNHPSGVFSDLDARHTWINGFGEDSDAHPPTQVLATWGQDRPPEDLELFWLGHLIGTIEPGADLDWLPTWVRRRNDPAAWVPLTRAGLPACYDWLDAHNRGLVGAGKVLTVGYDNLDRLVLASGGLDLPARFSSALASLWIRLSRRYRGIRGKIFLRPDLFERARTSVVDASKLRGAEARLTWTPEDIFRVVLRRFVANDLLRDWLAEQMRVQFDRNDVLGWMPPLALPEQLATVAETDAAEATQRGFAEALVGSHMGSGGRKGYTHTWILNHTQDANGQSLPRVTLNLILEAARGALVRGVDSSEGGPLSPSDLDAAQEEAGRTRLAELLGEHPVIERLYGLRDEVVPMSKSAAIWRLERAATQDDLPDGEAAFEALCRLGVLLERPARRGEDDLRADVPDLFRKALGIKRHGGPLQLKAR